MITSCLFLSLEATCNHTIHQNKWLIWGHNAKQVAKSGSEAFIANLVYFLSLDGVEALVSEVSFGMNSHRSRSAKRSVCALRVDQYPQYPHYFLWLLSCRDLGYRLMPIRLLGIISKTFAGCNVCVRLLVVLHCICDTLVSFLLLIQTLAAWSRYLSDPIVSHSIAQHI